MKVLLDLKAEYKALTGTDFPVAGRTPTKPKEKQEKAPQKSVAKEKKPAPVVIYFLYFCILLNFLILE